jgi:uncharacterized membrane protein
MHIFGLVVWLGGLMFQSAIVMPVLHAQTEYSRNVQRMLMQRFTGFISMSAWTLAVTGCLMMLLNPRFVWFQYHDAWSVLLGSKLIVFVLMIFYSFGYARMLAYLSSPSSNGGFNEKAELYRHRINQFRIINIALGILALLLGAAMIVYG